MLHTIKLEGRIPSKKNSRISTRSGRSFPSKNYSVWHKDAMGQLLKGRVPKAVLEECYIFYTFLFPDNRKCDLSNKIESINDLLVDYGFLKDDSRQVMPKFYAETQGVSKTEPSVIIRAYNNLEEFLTFVRTNAQENIDAMGVI